MLRAGQREAPCLTAVSADCQRFLEKSYRCQVMENMSLEELIAHGIYKK